MRKGRGQDWRLCLASLALENGGVVEIKGKDKVYAIAWPGIPKTHRTSSGSTEAPGRILVRGSITKSRSPELKQGLPER